ncbi:cytochrome P450 [Colletotrichum sublineola]|nr:cytochrome P450 [Colletotrichum sublineola]
MDSSTIPLHIHWTPQLVRLPSSTPALFVILFAIALWFALNRATADRSIPTIKSSKAWFSTRQDFAAHGVEIIEKGFKQVKSGVFRVTALDGSDLVVISPDHWLAICKKKDEEVSPALKEFFHCELHGAPFEEPFLYEYLRSRMPGFEDRYLDVISEALDEGLCSILGQGVDYSTEKCKRVIVQPQILHIYSHVIWRVILGSDFKPEAVEIFEQYSATLIPVMKKLKAQIPIVARITAAFSSEVRHVNALLERATTLFTPIFERCVQTVEQGSPNNSSVDKEWFEELIRMAPAEKRHDYKFLTNILIGFAFTFVFSPGPSTTQIVYEFAFRPDYVDQVLEEAHEVLGERSEDWNFTRDNLRGLSLLDSFCKETHKHHPTAASNLMKKVHKTQTLPNGVVLPAGTILEVVMTAAHLSNPTLQNPAEWNGRRYHDLRQRMSPAATGFNKYDWGSATRDDVNFGYASHMCPGRWAGCSIAKMFLIKLLAKYQIRPEDGVTERYKDLHLGQYITPDPTKHILFQPKY